MHVLLKTTSIQALYNNIQALLNSIHVVSVTKERTSQHDFLYRILQALNTFADILCGKKKAVEPGFILLHLKSSPGMF